MLIVGFLLFLISVCINSLSSSAQYELSLPAEQYVALYDLYNATAGSRWTWKNQESTIVARNGSFTLGIPWNFRNASSDPCIDHWQGVNCTCISFPSLSCTISALVLSNHTLNGTIPSSIGNLNNLTSLYLNHNNITGSVPYSIGNLTQLEKINFNDNQLIGSFPSSLYSLSSLNTLNMNFNFFNGTLPQDLSNLKLLEVFDISWNLFSGTLSSSFSALSQLKDLSIQFNTFNGSIPFNIGQLNHLTDFVIAGNYFTSSLPSSFYSLSKLKVIDCYVNHLTGTLSNSFNNFTNLVIFNIGYNQMFGSLTEEMFQFSLNGTSPLTVFGISYNQFDGSFPTSLSSCTSLLALLTSRNQLTGTIPMNYSSFEKLLLFEVDANYLYGNDMISIIKNHYNLYQLDLGNNQFSGMLPFSSTLQFVFSYITAANYFTSTIPLSFNHSTTLQLMEISYNYLTGTLPIWLASSVSGQALEYLNISSNLLTGNLYHRLEQVFPSKLKEVSLSYNYFIGSIPSSFFSLTSLQALILNNNQLTGEISNAFSSLSTLSLLFLQNNLFQGTIPTDLLSSSKLMNVDISNNGLTGTIPSFFDNNYQLQSFAASSNCFHGSLPSNICNATNLVSIALDGLSTSSSCRKSIFPGSRLFKAFTLRHNIDGSIPSCLFTLPFLTTLHLSGNGFTGSLSSSLVVSPSLIDLVLSYNELSGSIPLSIQTKFWSNLDLSYNAINGVLSTSFYDYSSSSSSFSSSTAQTSTSSTGTAAASASASTTSSSLDPSSSSLSLQVNRLSGEIPASIREMQNINILDGNIFECNFHRSHLPPHDPITNQYSCGSDLVDIGIIIWFVLGFLFFLFIVILWQRWKKNRREERKKETTPTTAPATSTELQEISFFYELFLFIVKLYEWNRLFDSKCSQFYERYHKTPITESTESNENSGHLSTDIMIRNTIIGNLSTMFSSRRISKDEDAERQGQSQQQQQDTSGGKTRSDSSGGGGGGGGGGGNRRSVFGNQMMIRQSMIISPSSSPLSTTTKRKGIVLLWLFNNNIRLLFLLYTCIILFLFLPLFSTLSQYYQSYDNTYAWTVGGVYLTGRIASLILFFSFFFYLLLVMLSFRYIWYPVLSAEIYYFDTSSRTDLRHLKNTDFLTNNNDEQNVNNEHTGKGSTTMNHFLYFSLTYLLISLINCIFMMIADICYVLIVIKFNTVVILFAELSLALFKIYLNNSLLWKLIPFIRKWLLRKFSSLDHEIIDKSIDFFHYSAKDITFLSVNITLNNLLYPALSILVISSDCFYNALFAASPVTSSYYYYVCQLYSVVLRQCVIDSPQSTTTSYDPPFTYGYLCASTIFTYYCPVFIFMFIFEAFVLPIFRFSIRFVLDYMNIVKERRIRTKALILNRGSMRQSNSTRRSSGGGGLIRQSETIRKSVVNSDLTRSESTKKSILNSDGMMIPSESTKKSTLISEAHSTPSKNSRFSLTFNRSFGRRSELTHSDDDSTTIGKGTERGTGTESEMEMSSRMSQLQRQSNLENEIVPEGSSIISMYDDGGNKPNRHITSWFYEKMKSLLRYPLQDLTSTPPSFNRRKSIMLFNKNRYVVRMNAYLIILVSYGTIFPPLAVIICCSVYMISYSEETIIGRLFAESKRLNYLWYEKQLSIDCFGIMNPLKYTLALIIPFSAGLFANLIFDTWGNTSGGWSAALVPALIFLGVSLIALRISTTVFGYTIKAKERSHSVQSDNSSRIELPDLSVKNSISEEEEEEEEQLPSENVSEMSKDDERVDSEVDDVNTVENPLSSQLYDV
jgi:Leucine-rich repeat (LRR) protein/uncharacterized membrane protein YgcG